MGGQRRKSVSPTPTRGDLYFEQQTRDDVLCVVHALNNLFGGPVVSVKDIVNYQTKNRQGKLTGTPACEVTSRGSLICSNQIVRRILEDVQHREHSTRYPLTASHPEVDSWENIEAVEWRYLHKNNVTLLEYVRDRQFEIIGVYGDLKHSDVGHATCIVVTTDGIWLKDSLTKSIQKVNTAKSIKNFLPYVILRRNFSSP